MACDACLDSVRFSETQPQVDGVKSCSAAYPYADRAVHGLLLAAKFEAIESAQHGICRLTDRALAKFGHLLPRGTDVVIVPIPTTPQRQRERGFDHVGWVAERVATSLQSALRDALVVDARGHQSHLESHDERRRNIAGAFACSRDVRGKRVVLVDDVTTSGATLAEAAGTLRAAGAADVYAFVLAQGGIKKPDVGRVRG